MSSVSLLDSHEGGLNSVSVAVYITDQLHDGILLQLTSWTLECKDGQPLAAVGARRQGDYITVTFLSAHVSIQGCEMVLLSASHVDISVLQGELAACRT